MWLRTSDEQHLQIVGNYFHLTGFVNIEAFDITAGNKWESDPMFVVMASKSEDCQPNKL